MINSVFIWLDGHHGSYWVLALGATALLVGWIGLPGWREAREPSRSRPCGWREGLAIFLFLLAWRWPFLFIG
jgi:hypothetical protein